MQVIEFYSICGSIIDMFFEASWGERFPHGGVGDDYDADMGFDGTILPV